VVPRAAERRPSCACRARCRSQAVQRAIVPCHAAQRCADSAGVQRCRCVIALLHAFFFFFFFFLIFHAVFAFIPLYRKTYPPDIHVDISSNIHTDGVVQGVVCKWCAWFFRAFSICFARCREHAPREGVKHSGAPRGLPMPYGASAVAQRGSPRSVARYNSQRSERCCTAQHLFATMRRTVRRRRDVAQRRCWFAAHAKWCGAPVPPTRY